jgi:hypothetical protein
MELAEATMQTDPAIDESIKDPLQEIKEKVDFWRTRLNFQLYQFNDMANFWRLIKPKRSGDLSGFANPQLTETLRATETIATFFYRALTSANPNFALLSMNPDYPQDQLWKSEAVLTWQQNVTGYRRKLMKACRSVALFGTIPVEEPWVVNGKYWESTDFMPRSLIQFAFDPLCFDMALSGWHCVIEYVTEDQLRMLYKAMPNVWSAAAIEEAISASSSTKNLSPELLARFTAAGYSTYATGGSSVTSNIYELKFYYGLLKDDDTHGEWCVATINDLKTIKLYRSPYPRRNFIFGHTNEFEFEPYSYGVGKVAIQAQPEMNSNRGRMHDVLTFSFFNQWLANRAANIKSSDLKIKPWGLVQVDGNPEDSLKALRPQIEGVNIGLAMENLMKGEFRTTVAAPDSLQAIVTQATATESSLAQTEAVRRLSVMAEIFSESVLREHISKMHENNLTFLDQPFCVAVTGMEGPMRIFPSDLAPEVEVTTKVVTDKDFRPQRNKDLLQFLQTVTSIRSQNPQLGEIDLEPFVEEFARSVGMNPKRVWRAVPAMPGLIQPPGNAPQGAPMPNAMDRVGAVQSQMESMRSRAGEVGAAAREMAAQG